ncbi:MAG TPA: glycosyltransferase 87 family protein, partial [Polyangia bacterium]|nr:glycosyltransferase 87 family protein [Polyangia bacterium]
MTVPPARRAGLDRLLIGLLVLVHVTAVVSIVRQPWNVAPQAAARSVLWPLFHDAVHRLGPGADFFALVHGGVNTARGQSPYDAEEPPQRTPYFYHYRYLPGPAKTLGRALARLVPRAAYVLWVVVMEAALAGIAALLWRRLRAAGDGGAGRALGAVALLLLSTPYFLEAHMGQFTFVTMVLVTAALLLLEPAGAGLAAGIAAAALFALAAELKVFPLVAAPALLKVRRGWWGLAGAAALFLLLDLPAFHAAPRLYHQFVESNFADAPNGLDPGNHGLLYL